MKHDKKESKNTTVLVAVLVFIGILFTIIIGVGYLFLNSGFDIPPIQEIETGLKTISLYIDTLPYDVDSTYSNALREARSFWEKRQNVFFKEVSSQQEADVVVRWVKEFGGRTLGHTVYSDFIEIGLGDSVCLGKWKVYKYQTVLDIAIHELGHALGYEDDYENVNSVMYYKITTKYETDIEETDVLPDGWTRFYPVCTKNPVATYSFEITSSEPLNIYVVSSRQDYELLADGKTFTHYPDCAGSEIKFYKKVCTISSGSGIALKNPTTFGLGPDAQFTIKIKES